MKGSYPLILSLSGISGGKPQFCPSGLKSSGGAPSDIFRAKSPLFDQTSKLSFIAPMARS
ncbi:MAG: hypothetical protein N2257_04590 [Thermodesulfovibrionales bacterium]|nr:hypothetical protein [Thermodesulfovibrionales bacterium]